MGRYIDRNVGNGSGEDRLSAVMAVALVAANVAGGGLLAVLKVLDVPPLVAASEGPREASLAGWRPARPGPTSAGLIRVTPTPGVARLDPAGGDSWRR